MQTLLSIFGCIYPFLFAHARHDLTKMKRHMLSVAENRRARLASLDDFSGAPPLTDSQLVDVEDAGTK